MLSRRFIKIEAIRNCCQFTFSLFKFDDRSLRYCAENTNPRSGLFLRDKGRGEVGGVGRNDRGSIAMTYTTGEGGGGGLYLRAGEAMAEINFSLTYDAS